MLIDTIVDFCDTAYKADDCCNCSYGDNCPKRCDTCLHYIHTPTAVPAPRQYDCPNMANFYTCKYSHKYTSELIYALQQLRELHIKKHLNVMSIGCGPCTDLFALDYLKEQNEFSFDSIKYRGIDNAKGVWQHIHQEMKNQKPDGFQINFFYEDITELIDTIIEVNWIPDLIIFQYVFSDMQKHCEPQKLREFISKIAGFINDKMDANTYIVLNDINLSTGYNGGREHFDSLLRQVSSAEYRKYHFENSNKPNHFNYGVEYPTNELMLKPPRKIRDYEPFDSCASAQMIEGERMIISASRRTDIPSYYSDWFFNRLKEGFVYVRNPMNIHQVSKVSLSADVVDGIVLWTKNPLPMLDKLDELAQYSYYFQFTLNSYQQDVEVNLPSNKRCACPCFSEAVRFDRC